MKKRFIIWLSALLITLLPALGSRAEEAAGPGSVAESDVLIIYVPATKDDIRITTAEYVAMAIQERWPGQTRLYKTTSEKAAKKTSNDNGLDFNDVFGYKKEYLDSMRPALGDTASVHTVWLIVPSEASEDVANQSEWITSFGNLLAGNGASSLHVVFIGNHAIELNKRQEAEISLAASVPQESAGLPDSAEGYESDEQPESSDETMDADPTETPDIPAAEPVQQPAPYGTQLEGLAANYPGQVSWIKLRDSFDDSATEIPTTHTGDFFIASLYGEEAPMNLDYSQNDEGIREFYMPGKGNAFVLVKGDGSDITVWNPMNNPVTDTDSTTVKLKNKSTFHGLLLKEIDEGKYRIDSGTADIKIYYYPRYAAAELKLDLGEVTQSREWPREPNPREFRLTIAGQPGDISQYTAGMEINLNDANIAYSNPDIDYDPDRNAWVLSVPIAGTDQKISITPQISLRMPDGNQVRSWKGETEVRFFSDTEISANQVEEQIIYYYGDAPGNPVSYTFDQIFTYGKGEVHGITVADEEKIEEEYGIEINKDDTNEAITVTLNDIAKVDDKDDKKSCTITVTLESNSGKKADNYLTIVFSNTKKLFDVIQVAPDQIDEAVDAGKDVKATVTIPSDAVQEWMKASRNNSSFPALENMTVRGVIRADDGEDELNSTETISLNNLDGEWTALVQVPVPGNLKAGRYVLQVNVSSNDKETDYLEKTIPFEITNNGPVYQDDAPSGTIKNDIDGFFGLTLPFVGTLIDENYEEFDLLKLVGLDGDKAWNAFEDAETPNDLKVTLTIAGVDGLRKEAAKQEAPEETQESAEETGETAPETTEEKADAGTWTYELTADDRQITDKIYVTKPGTYTITLTADDGANDPVVQEIKVTVESSWRKIFNIARWAVLGLIVLIIALLIFLHLRKPKFDRIRIRCLVWADDSQERGREMMNKTRAVTMTQFGRKPVTLNTALMLAHQPAMTKEQTDIAEDITLLPTKHDELNIAFGKKAMAALGQQDKKVNLSQGNVHRIRLGNQYVLIENVQ